MAISDGPRVRVADGYASLVAHVLAHVPLEQPGNLFDPRYVAWSRAQLEPDVQALLEHDAALIGARWRAEPALDVLHGLFDLQRELAGFRRTAGRSLAQLDAHEVAAPGVLASLRACVAAPVIELLHTTLALIDEPLARVLAAHAQRLEQARAELEGWTRRLCPGVPGFERARVELVWGLGMHGRALHDRVLVGAPAAWNGLSSARQAVLAAHEQLVTHSGRDDYWGQEWVALTELARIMLALDDPPLRAAHAAWLAELELGAVLDGALARGELTPDRRARLLEDHHDRAAVLAAASAPSPMAGGREQEA